MAKGKAGAENSSGEGPGRPSEYDPKYCQAIIEFFSIKPYHNDHEQLDMHTGEITLEKGAWVANDFPTFAAFAVKIGVHRETLLNWCDAYPEFFDAYKRAKELQENFLVVNGLKELTPPAFTIFVAKNVLGWRDKQPGEADVIVNNNSFAKLTDAELDAQIDKLMKEKK